MSAKTPFSVINSFEYNIFINTNYFNFQIHGFLHIHGLFSQLCNSPIYGVPSWLMSLPNPPILPFDFIIPSNIISLLLIALTRPSGRPFSSTWPINMPSLMPSHLKETYFLVNGYCEGIHFSSRINLVLLRPCFFQVLSAEFESLKLF